MTSVFLSYGRDDLTKARRVAHGLEKAGYSVWWDRQIKSGAQFSKEIEQALKQAEAVVVLWSETAVESPWVRDEAAVGRDSGRLVPVMIGKSKPPLGFRQYQTTDLSRWNGRTNAAAFKALLAALEDHAGPPPAPAFTASRGFGFPSARGTIVVGALAALSLLAAVLIWQPWSKTSSVPTVMVKAATPSAEGDALARDILARLGDLHSAKTDALNLVQGEGTSGKVNLIFEVDGATLEYAATANLVLLAGKDGALLWSKDFEQPLARQSDLKQQLAFTAARVLGCALEAMAPQQQRLSQSVLKLYLNACALLGNSFMTQSGEAIPILERVTRQAPHFEPGWAKLLLATTDRYYNLNTSEQKVEAVAQRQRILAARKVNPNIPEAYIAEIELIQGPAFLEQFRLLSLAAEADPENTFVLSTRSLVNTGVGRMEDAVSDARQAANLDPLSPAMRNAYIAALTYAGRFDAANAELAKAERLWPGSSSILDAKRRLLLPYGNPAEALRLARSGVIEVSPTMQAFVEARLNRTSENIERVLKLARSDFENDPDNVARLSAILAEFERNDELFNLLMRWRNRAKIPYFVEVLFRPQFAGLRSEPRFMQLAAHLGTLDYWVKSGNWPDFCREPDLPYDCKAEAAKLG